MRRIWAVAKRDYIAVVRTRGFILSLILTPLFLGIVLVLPMLPHLLNTAKEAQTVEVVDKSGRILPLLKRAFARDRKAKRANFKLITPKQPPASATAFFQARRKLLKAHKRYALVWIGKDTLEAYKLAPKQRNAQHVVQLRALGISLTKMRPLHQALMRAITKLRLDALGPVAQKVRSLRADLPLVIQAKDLGGKRLGAAQFLKQFMTGIIFIMLLYLTIQITGNNLVTSVIEEKSSRIMEVLLSSITPSQLLIGKVLGLGAAGLTMVSVFASVGFIGSQFSQIPVQLSNLALFIVYYLLAFALYSFILAGLGSICTSEKEAQQTVAPVMIILILPAILSSQLIENPNSTLSLFLSYFPLTAPGAMLSRMGVTTIPTSQLVFSILSMCAATAIALWLSVQVFRIGVLMTGKKPSLRHILRLLTTR